MQRAWNSCGPPQEELVAAGQVLPHPVLVVMLEMGLKKVFKVETVRIFGFLQCIYIML